MAVCVWRVCGVCDVCVAAGGIQGGDGETDPNQESLGSGGVDWKLEWQVGDLD